LKHGEIEKIVTLDKPTLILLDSERCLHAAQRTEAVARKAFRKANATAAAKSKNTGKRKR
jgi:hypothetical protein